MKSVYQVLSFDMISKIFIGFVSIFIIRYLAEDQYATYTLALSLITIVSQTISSTFRRIYIVGFENFNMKAHKRSFLGLQIVLAFVIALFLLPMLGNIPLFLITFSVIFGYILIEFLKTTYQQELKFKEYSAIEITRSTSFFLFTIILILLLKFDLKAWQVLTVQSISMIIIYIVSGFLQTDNSQVINIKEAFKIGRDIVKGSYFYLLGYTLFGTMLGNLDVLLLKLLANENELATYGSAFRYYSLMLLALGSVNSVLLPVIQKVENLKELHDIYRTHRKLITIFVPLVILGAWLSKWVIPIIDLGKYPDAVYVFQILAISALISFVFSPHTNFIMKYEDFKFLFIIIIISVIINISLNIFLITRLGAIGTAWATLITFAFSNIITYIRSRNFQQRLKINKIG